MSAKCPLCGSVMVKREEDERELEGLKETEREVLEAIQHQDDQELKLQAEIASLEVTIEADRDRRRSGDLKKMELTMEKNKILSEINLVKIREDQLAHAENDFQNEIKEGQALVGDEISSYRDFIRPDEPDGQVQEENRKKIERLKIKLEDAGLGNDREVIKEFEEVSKRDQFLEQEMADLERSIQSLETLMADLKEKIEMEFQAGVRRNCRRKRSRDKCVFAPQKSQRIECPLRRGEVAHFHCPSFRHVPGQPSAFSGPGRDGRGTGRSQLPQIRRHAGKTFQAFRTYSGDPQSGDHVSRRRALRRNHRPRRCLQAPLRPL